MVCDWLLSTRTAVWQSERSEGAPEVSNSETELVAFQADLSSLRTVAAQVSGVQPKVGFLEQNILLTVNVSF